ncbi:MDR family MFS transporter [Saccharothrix australiensis]|uniref:EmrB/QacA subfamily drug resistance transporter n=1 Tax=Saccharothrix australiensis TaxID=2072 RepID=A0A495W2Q9_9PSEU|nr:MDR family MFS transporter [Saccharothrix australiensis]RKT55654.1 EmrB/QacA subfamily drug resistance transporter [Saccharothrix australiensis]
MTTGKPADTGGVSAVVEQRFAALGSRSRWAITLSVLAGIALSMLDQTVIGTAMPQVVADLHGTEAMYTWIVTTYLLTSTVTVPLYGRFSDLYGRKPLLLTGLTIFLVGSLLSGLATSMVALIFFRAVQGIGAGALLTLGATLLRDFYPPHTVVRLQGLLAANLVLSFLGGPLIGGFLTDHATWRWAFFINLPIGVVIVGVLAVLLPHQKVEHRTGRFDVPGVVLLISGVSLVLLGLSNKASVVDGTLLPWWSPQVAGLLALGLVLLVVLVRVERRAGAPVLPLHMLRNRTFLSATVAGLFFRVAMFPTVLFMPLYFQQVRGHDATTSGLLLLPVMAGLVASNRLTSLVVVRRGRAKAVLVAAAGLLTVVTGLFALLDADTSLWTTSAFLVLVGLGLGPSMGGISMVAQSSVDRADVGSATGGFVLLGQLGGTIGLAAGQTLFAQRLTGAGAPGVADPELMSSTIGSTIAVLGLVSGVLAFAALAVMEDIPLRVGPPKPPPARTGPPSSGSTHPADAPASTAGPAGGVGGTAPRPEAARQEH